MATNGANGSNRIGVSLKRVASSVLILALIVRIKNIHHIPGKPKAKKLFRNIQGITTQTAGISGVRTIAGKMHLTAAGRKILQSMLMVMIAGIHLVLLAAGLPPMTMMINTRVLKMKARARHVRNLAKKSELEYSECPKYGFASR